jgi:hypothetical protein
LYTGRLNGPVDDDSFDGQRRVADGRTGSQEGRQRPGALAFSCGLSADLPDERWENFRDSPG